MGIHLDWEVESEGGWSAVGEDPGHLTGRRRQQRRVLGLVAAVLAVGILAAAAVAFQMHRSRERARAELEQVVAAETLALRIGDRDAFLAAQLDLGEWRSLQSGTFEQAQALGGRLVVEGEIIEMEIGRAQARVVLREILDGRPYQVTWFYDRGRSGWQHSPPRPDAWGERVEQTIEGIPVSYREADRNFADTLAPRIAAWWQTACALTGCTDPPPLRIWITTELLARPGWADYDEWTLEVPSPLLGRVAEDGTLDPLLLGTLADLIAARRAQFALDGAAASHPAPDQTWFEQELAVWLRWQMDSSAPPSVFIGPLAESYGETLIPDLIESLRRGEGLVAALQRLTGIPALDLPADWSGYLTHRLRAEAHLIARGYIAEADLLFRDYQRPHHSPGLLIDFSTEQMADLESITVVSTQRVAGDVLLAEVTFRPHGRLLTPPVELVAFEPFRLVGDQWRHTTPGLADWGALREVRSPHFTLLVTDLDAPAVENLLPELESAWERIEVSFALPPGPPIPYLVLVTPTQIAAQAGQTTAYESLPGSMRDRITYLAHAHGWEGSPGSYRGLLVISSPFAGVRQAGISAADHVTAVAIWELSEAVVRERAAPFPAEHPLAVALIGQGFERAGGSPTGLPYNAERGWSGSPLPTLGVLWPEAIGADYRHSSPPTSAEFIAAQVLVDLLVERKGSEALAALLREMPAAASLDDWLQRSLGISAGQIEDEWRLRLQAALSTES